MFTEQGHDGAIELPPLGRATLEVRSNMLCQPSPNEISPAKTMLFGKLGDNIL